MSIDADLNAGIITEEDARNRRRMLEREADFYGSMDGSIRFVRGDAIAGILITLINVVGGFAIGVFQQDMNVAEAAKVYTLLTIGDGLVTQLPALVVSTAAGIIVTRATTDKNLPNELIGQMSNNPAAFSLAAGALFFFGTIPGLPHIPFFVLSALVGGISYRLYQNRQKKERVEQKKMDEEKRTPVPEKVESILPLDVMELEVGYELIPLVDADRNGELLERIKSVRRQFALDLGFIVPPLHIRDNLQLKASDYAIVIKGVEVARGSVMTGRLLAMSPGKTEKEIPGVKTQEPTFGLPSVWINASTKQEAQMAGYTMVDPATVITTHIKETIKTQCAGVAGSPGSPDASRQIQGNQSEGGGRTGPQPDDPRKSSKGASESFERADFHSGLKDHFGISGRFCRKSRGSGCVDRVRAAGIGTTNYQKVRRQGWIALSDDFRSECRRADSPVNPENGTEFLSGAGADRRGKNPCQDPGVRGSDYSDAGDGAGVAGFAFGPDVFEETY